MTVAADTDFFGDAKVNAQTMTWPWWRRHGSYVLIGLILLGINFPKLILRLVDANIGSAWIRSAFHSIIQAIQATIALLVGPNSSAFFQRTMAFSFALLWLFVCLLIVLSLRRRGLRMLGYGLAGIVLGYLALPLIAWLAAAVVLAIHVTVYVVRAVGSGVVAIAAFVARMTVPLVLLMVGLALLYALYAHRDWLRKHAMKLLSGAIVLAIGCAILAWLYRHVMVPIFQFFVWLLSPIVYAVTFVVKWILTIVFVTIFGALISLIALLMIAFTGSLMITQFQAAWHAARSVRQMLVAGFAIGSAIALIVLESIATPSLATAINTSWHDVVSLSLSSSHSGSTFVTSLLAACLPGSVSSFAFTYLTNLQAPAFDSFILLVVVGLGCMSIASRLTSSSPITDENPSITYIAKEYALLIVGLFVGLLVIFGSAVGESDT